MGLATSLLHRFGVDENHDPYNLIETLPLKPGAKWMLNYGKALACYLPMLTQSGSVSVDEKAASTILADYFRRRTSDRE